MINFNTPIVIDGNCQSVAWFFNNRYHLLIDFIDDLSDGNEVSGSVKDCIIIKQQHIHEDYYDKNGKRIKAPKRGNK